MERWSPAKVQKEKDSKIAALRELVVEQTAETSNLKEELKKLKRKLGNLKSKEKKRKETDKKHKEKDNCICSKRQKLGTIIPYDYMEPGSQRKSESVCRKFVIAASKAVDKTWSKFLSNSVARKKACIEEVLNIVFESLKGRK